MSEVKGRLITCTRCGKQIFEKYISRGQADGGYTSWDNYDNKSKDEGWETFIGISGNYCPKCAAEYKDMIENFKAGNIGEKV